MDDSQSDPGNRQSEYERWVRPIEPRMMRAVWRILRDPDDADDAFGQALENIWRRWPKIRRHPNPPALIMTICVHAAYDHLRKRIRRAGHEVSNLEPERHLCTDPAPDQLAVAGETRAMIYDAISQLPTRQRIAVSLRLLADLSYDAIAQALGCSEVTARTHTMRALHRLRSQLADLRPEARKPEPRKEIPS
jgi:RNA polymerase sigma factor (sigma-70 family)